MPTHVLLSSPAKAPARVVPRPLADVAGFLVNQLAAQLRVETAEALTVFGLHPRQVGILLVVQEGAISQQLLGMQLGMDRTTTMQLVTALERDGIVAREDDPNDRRAYQVTLTVAGRKLTDQVATQVVKAEQRVLSRLSADEQRTLKALARKALERPE